MPDLVPFSRPKTLSEGMMQFQRDRGDLEALGVTLLPSVQAYLSEDVVRDPRIAMDALPTLFTDANSAVPAVLTTLIDPDVFRILFAPSKVASALTERKVGTWLDDVVMFPVIEPTGEVSSYGDYNDNGTAGVNTGWPPRQNYLFQVIKEYGEREAERGSLARINWAAEIDRAAALTIQKFFNFSYLFGINGLYNYGISNDPNLAASLTPAPKAAGGTAWVIAGRINATANEIFNDVQSLFLQLVLQTAGLVDRETEMLLLLSPGSEGAMTATNSFGVNVADLLKKNFPNLRTETIAQFGVRSTDNTQGIVAGNFAMLMALELEGQRTVYASYSEKQRTHPMIRHMSSFRQKLSAGTWGVVLRMPAAVTTMIGM